MLNKQKLISDLYKIKYTGAIRELEKVPFHIPDEEGFWIYINLSEFNYIEKDPAKDFRFIDEFFAGQNIEKENEYRFWFNDVLLELWDYGFYPGDLRTDRPHVLFAMQFIIKGKRFRTTK